MNLIQLEHRKVAYEREQRVKGQQLMGKYPFTVFIEDGTPEFTEFGMPGRDDRKSWCYSAQLRGSWMTVDGHEVSGSFRYGRHYCFSNEHDAMIFLMTFGGTYINTKEPTDVNAR